MGTGRCLKCERSNSADGCRWCLYKSFKYCAGPSETKVDLGTSLPWDQCLEAAAAHTNCFRSRLTKISRVVEYGYALNMAFAFHRLLVDRAHCMVCPTHVDHGVRYRSLYFCCATL